MIQGAIFDMDGTVLHSMPVWDRLTERFLTQHALKLTREDYEAIEGMTQMGVSEYVLETYPHLPFTPQTLCEGMDELIAARYSAIAKPKLGVHAFLTRLRKAGIPCAVATLTGRVHAERVLREFGLMQYFDCVVTIDDVGVSKREPDIYLLAAQKIGREPAQCIVFEDAPYAAQTAKKAGFQVCGVEEHAYREGRALLHEVSDLIIKEGFGEVSRAVLGGGNTMPAALTIAGSDCSGGAGIQADLKAFTALGVFGQSCITAVTVQNTLGVTGIHEVPGDIIAGQLDAVFCDIVPEAVKIGMVSSAKIIRIIAAKLRQYKPAYVVLDPVMVSTSGSKLMADDAAQALKEEMMPLADLVTPNIPEAEALTGMTVENREDMLAAAHKIAQHVKGAVLLKGGHLAFASDDLLLADTQEIWLCSEHITNTNTHGTGCTLSSAIAAGLAKGLPLSKAVEEGKAYVTQAIAWQLDLGKGRGPLCHTAQAFRT